MANIRTARRSGLVLRGGRNVRSTLWGDVTTTSTNLTAAGAAVLLNVTGAAFLALRPFTVVRVRGEWVVFSDQQAADESFHASLGFCVVSDQASAIGITAVPTPGTDRASDLFFVYEQWLGAYFNVSASGFETINSRSYDSKAMRKVEEGQDMIVTLEQDPLVAGGMIVDNSARVLIKLH